MVNYAVELYATPALAEAAIELLETSSTFDIIPYREGAHAKFVVIVPSMMGPM